MISDSVRFSCFYLCKFSGCCTCGDSQHRAMNVCVCATSRELIKCGPKRGLQPLKSEPEQSPHKIRGGSMGIFKANLKPHPLLVTKGRERTKGSRMLRSQRHVAHITCRRRHCSRCSCIQMQLESERQEFSVAVEAFL